MAEMLRGKNVCGQLMSQVERERQTAKEALLKIITSIKSLARQNLAIRGHTDDNSNFTQLLKLCGEDSDELRQWISRDKYKWVSHDIQNELLEIMVPVHST